MTAAQDSRAQFEDGAWYWVEKEGWIGDPPKIAPACYKAEFDAWYSFEFSGISTRFLKVLEPCRRAALSAEPVASIYVTEGGDREFDDWKVPLLPGRNLLYAAPQPAAQERKPLTGEEVKAVMLEAGYDSAPPSERAVFISGMRHAERSHGITGQHST